MHHRVLLPPALIPAFHLRQAEEHGIGRGRCNAPDLARPFPGIRSVAVPDTFLARVRYYAPRLREGQAFSRRTAARLRGLPLPWFWTPHELLDIAVPEGAAPPKVAGVAGHRLSTVRMRAALLDGVPVLDPVATLFVLAAELTATQLLVLIEALITPSGKYPNLVGPRPLTDAGEIDMRLAEWGSFPGVGRVRTALTRARAGVDSPKETEARVVIMAAGLPEPEVQYVVHERGRKIATVDLAYPEWKIAIEYEGDGHRTDPEQWREDIRRQRELEERGWLVLRITQLDLADGRAAFLARLRRAVAQRSAA
ncbi:MULTISPECIES: endonuclease domain-containing protein [Microbacterium]|uniref:endonuclease domain-containing protein n=1 Tax=Microbacterium TaxID=33882 RepID=UPI00217EED79|nr:MULTISPECIES: hypothetical protein [Microbacterium]UWF77198.1 hypothetical protein JSY13_10455 [Microbacterium neungamense]WCM55354.1 hypothetical protein JRG78_10440 [Microbacterium sp. EF45047]